VRQNGGGERCELTSSGGRWALHQSRRAAAAGIALLAGAALLLPIIGTAQQAAPQPAVKPPAAEAGAGAQGAKAAAETHTVKFYDVADLLEGVPAADWKSDVFPPSMLRAANYSPPGAGLMGHGDREPDPPIGVIEPEQLLELVQPLDVAGFVEPSYARFVGSMLAVNASADTHAKIAPMLEELRSRRPFGQPVDVVAHWVLLPAGEAATLTKPATADVDPQKLSALPEGAVYARSATRLLTGQQTTLQAGRAGTVVYTQTPSVGYTVAAYDPQVSHVLSGTTTRVRVTVVGSTATVALLAAAGDLDTMGKPIYLQSFRSGVPTTQPAGEAGIAIPADQGQTTAAEVDRMNAVVMHLETTAKVPLGRPTLVGSATLEPATGAAIGKGDPRQLCLILEVRDPSVDKPADR